MRQFKKSNAPSRSFRREDYRGSLALKLVIVLASLTPVAYAENLVVADGQLPNEVANPESTNRKQLSTLASTQAGGSSPQTKQREVQELDANGHSVVSTAEYKPVVSLVQRVGFHHDRKENERIAQMVVTADTPPAATSTPLYEAIPLAKLPKAEVYHEPPMDTEFVIGTPIIGPPIHEFAAGPGCNSTRHASAFASGQMFDRTVIQPDWTQVLGSGCDMCAANACCCRQVEWTANVDVLFMDRTRSDGFDEFLAVCAQTLDGVRGRDVDFDMTGGPRISLARNNLCGGLDVEGIYYQIEEFSGNDLHFGDLIIRDVNALGEGTAFVDYESRLRNVELNLSRWCTNFTKLIAGGRWLQIDETGSISASTAAFPNYRDEVDVENSLVGGQIGILHTIWDRGNNFSLTGAVKGGVFVNHTSRETVGFGTTNLSDDTTSLLGEFELTAQYRWSDRWAFTMGYQLLAISDAALALDQFFSPNNVFYQDVVLHGVRLGISFTY